MWWHVLVASYLEQSSNCDVIAISIVALASMRSGWRVVGWLVGSFVALFLLHSKIKHCFQQI